MELEQVLLLAEVVEVMVVRVWDLKIDLMLKVMKVVELKVKLQVMELKVKLQVVLEL